MGASAISILFTYKRVYVLVFGLIIALFIANSHGHDRACGNYETNMQYRDVVLIQKDACHYLESNFYNKKVLSSWPLTYDLFNPFAGYVKKPLNVTTSPDAGYDLMAFTLQGDFGQTKNLEEEINGNQQLFLIKRFARNGKFVDIFFNK